MHPLNLLQQSLSRDNVASLVVHMSSQDTKRDWEVSLTLHEVSSWPLLSSLTYPKMYLDLVFSSRNRPALCTGQDTYVNPTPRVLTPI